jgi:hypothetical protein
MKILKKITLVVCLIFALTAVVACKESPLQSVSDGQENLSQENSSEYDTSMSSDGLYEDEESSSEEDSTFTSNNRHEIVLSEFDWEG